MLNNQKKQYSSPQCEFMKISVDKDILLSSNPGAGEWGYGDQETLQPAPNPFEGDDDDFIW